MRYVNNFSELLSTNNNVSDLSVFNHLNKEAQEALDNAWTRYNDTFDEIESRCSALQTYIDIGEDKKGKQISIPKLRRWYNKLNAACAPVGVFVRKWNKVYDDLAYRGSETLTYQDVEAQTSKVLDEILPAMRRAASGIDSIANEIHEVCGHQGLSGGEDEYEALHVVRMRSFDEYERKRAQNAKNKKRPTDE